jgi:hypothetical protein
MAALPVQGVPLPYVVTLAASMCTHQHVPDSDRTAAPNPLPLTAYETVSGPSEGPEVKRRLGS